MSNLVNYLRVKETSFNQWDINSIEYVSKTNEVYQFRYVPRAYDAGVLHEGALLTIDMTTIDSWDDFQSEILENEKFIRCFFDEFRNGYVPEKVYRRVMEWAKDWQFDDMPKDIRERLLLDQFWMRLDENYMQKVKSIVGEMPSYRDNV